MAKNFPPELIGGLKPIDCQHAREPADILPAPPSARAPFNYCPYCGIKLEAHDTQPQPDLESCIVPGRRCED